MSDEQKKAATKARLKAFLRGGHPDDVQSVLVHTLMAQAEKQGNAETPAPKPEKK